MNNSARRVLEILELFAETDVPLTISDVAGKLGYPKTSVFDIFAILHERGYITRDNDRAKTYVIGPKTFQVGSAYLQRNDLYSITHPHLLDLKQRLGETCYLAIEEGGMLTYLDKVESDLPIRASSNIGARNLLYLTGLGKAILAGYPEEKVRQITAGGMEIHTRYTFADTDALLAELEITRRRGYAIDRGEDNEYVRCVAAPIRDDAGKFFAAVSISMPDTRFTPEKEKEAGKAIQETALEISRKLGYRAQTLY